MGNEPNVLTVDNEVQILGTRKGFYKPGRKIAMGFCYGKKWVVWYGYIGDEMFAHMDRI